MAFGLGLGVAAQETDRILDHPAAAEVVDAAEFKAIEPGDAGAAARRDRDRVGGCSR